jgi:hypothetical protein
MVERSDLLGIGRGVYGTLRALHDVSFGNFRRRWLMNSPSLVFSLASCVALAMPLVAQEAARSAAPPPRGAAPAAPKASQAAPVQPGLIAFVDLATGKLVEPSPEDLAAFARSAELQRSLNQSSEGLTEVKLPDGGGYLVDLEGRFQSMLVATIGPDGKLRMGHPVARPQAARIDAAAPKAAKKEGDRK